MKKQVATLVKHHDIRCENSAVWVRRQLRKFGPDLFLQLLAVHKADITGQNPKLLHRLDDLAQCEALTKEILAESPCFSLRELAVNGTDLINSGIPQGKKIGQALQFLLSAVVEQECKNEKSALLCYLQQHRSQFT